MNENILRRNLTELLRGGSAHVSAEKALDDINPELRNFRPQQGLHSIYEELEHMRLAQEDIYRYTLEEGWESPPWPEGYWPANNHNCNDDLWEITVSHFFEDLESIIGLINDINIDLTSEIPHGEGRTYLREILLVADHNSYHLGKIVDIRKMLGDW